MVVLVKQPRGISVGAYRARDYTIPLTRIDVPLLTDNKQQELTSLTLETPLPRALWIALIGYTGQYDTVGKLIVQHDIKEVARISLCEKKKSLVDRDPCIATAEEEVHRQQGD